MAAPTDRGVTDDPLGMALADLRYALAAVERALPDEAVARTALEVVVGAARVLDTTLGLCALGDDVRTKIAAPFCGSSGESTQAFMQRTDPVGYGQCRDAGRF